MHSLRLRIDPVIKNAEEVKLRVEKELPGHTGLISLAAGVAKAARESEAAARRLRQPFGWHRLPVAFLSLALLSFAYWTYEEFIKTAPMLKIALPDRDASALHKRATQDAKLKLRVENVAHSSEAVDLVKMGRVDLAFVQGGVDIPDNLPQLETPQPELVLWLVRQSITDLRSVHRVLTSDQGAGSHLVAQKFMKAWNLDSQISYQHDWARLSEDAPYEIPANVDAVFVVKDPADEKTLKAIDRLANAGFELRSPDLGARLAHLDYLRVNQVRAGYLRSVPPFPAETVPTYGVATFLVTRSSLKPRMLAAASHLFDGQHALISDRRFEPTLGETSELLQGVDAFLGIIINIVLAFLALMGVEMLAYRKRFHELNSLVSLISIHQSSKGVLGVTDHQLRRDHLLYLTLCSDLLGLVSMIGGYYTQENSSLLFNGMPEIIHQRCDGLKINIQLKILHATIDAGRKDVPVQAETGTAALPA